MAKALLFCRSRWQFNVSFHLSTCTVEVSLRNTLNPKLLIVRLSLTCQFLCLKASAKSLNVDVLIDRILDKDGSLWPRGIGILRFWLNPVCHCFAATEFPLSFVLCQYTVYSAAGSKCFSTQANFKTKSLSEQKLFSFSHCRC